jgi:hypothetical protein
MCDYSLHDVAARAAEVGDKLVTTKFNNFTLGFASSDNPKVAVCLRPGTEIAFEKNAEYQHPFRRLLPRFNFGMIGERMARFRQLNKDQPSVHHDALEFANGKVVLLTRLVAGQRATVLQLPASARAAEQDGSEKNTTSERLSA